MKLSIATAALALFCGGCMTAQMYDGPKREPDEVARISGDLRVTAGVPVTVILRQVDGRTLSLQQSSVEVLPGSHRLLVDCRIAQTQGVSRHLIQAEVVAGEHYRLLAATGPGLRECTSVGLKASESRADRSFLGPDEAPDAGRL